MAGRIAAPLIVAYAAFFGLKGIDFDSKSYSEAYCTPDCSYEIIKETKHWGLFGPKMLKKDSATTIQMASRIIM
jgi:hypothetical protein